MWFLFGILSLITFTIYFGVKRYRNTWPAISGRINNTVYLHHTSMNKGKVLEHYIGCHIFGDMDLSIKTETHWDRFFKFFGISVEHQVGRENFDDEIYIISDHPDVCAAMTKSVELQHQIQQLLKRVNKFGHVKGLHIGNQRIWIRFSPFNKEPSDITLLAKEFVPYLTNISQGFATQLQNRKTGFRDPFFWKAACILAMSTGMAITGAVHFFGLNLISIPFTIDTNELLVLSFMVGSGIIGVLLFLTILFLGRTARTHLVLLELVSIGYLGAIGTSAAFIRDINMEWDSSPAQQFVVQIHDKTTHRSRRHTSYYLHVDDWTKSGDEKKISVSSSMYHSYQIRDRLAVEQMPGFLGFRWVSEINPYNEY